MRQFLGICFGHGVMRRQDEISTLLRLSVTVSFSLLKKTIWTVYHVAVALLCATCFLDYEKSKWKLLFYGGKIILFCSRLQRVGNDKQSWFDLTPL